MAGTERQATAPRVGEDAEKGEHVPCWGDALWEAARRLLKMTEAGRPPGPAVPPPGFV